MLRTLPTRVLFRFPGVTTSARNASTSSTDAKKAKAEETKTSAVGRASEQQASPKSSQKTVAELDEELRQKMQGLAGDGGDAGVECEDGQPVAMKRSVKNNMFRLI